MPTQTERPSTSVSLEDRYKSQKCGGSYDAKSIQTSTGARMPILDASGNGPASTETQWTNPNFLVKAPILQTELKDCSNEQSSKQLSIHMKGFTNKRYKP
jgi:hypothetical protein